MKTKQKQARTGLRLPDDTRPAAMFVFVQLMAVCAGVIVAATMVVGGAGMVSTLRDIPDMLRSDWEGLLSAAIVLLAGTGVGCCLLWLLAEFVLMCGRVRKGTAFTQENVRALGRIVLAFVIGGVLLLPLGKPMMDWLLLGMRGVRSPIWWLLPSFVAWAAALMVRAIQVLMRRAVEMQTEQDLTV